MERFNRTLCESLAKLSIQHENRWDKHIAPVLFAYRTTKHNTTKLTPFYLVYGREAKLPMDNLELEGETNLLSHLGNLVDNLPLKRQEAIDQISDAQLDQKWQYNSRIRKEIDFHIGQKVLYYDAAKEKQWTGKLQPKWKGPYYIHQVGINGAYKLRTIEGKVLKSPVNGSLLKEYHDRQHWEPMIVIDGN